MKYLTHVLFFVGLFSAQMSSHVCTPAGDPADINLEIKKIEKPAKAGHHVAVFHRTKTNHAAARGSNINIRRRYLFIYFLMQFVSGHSGQ